MNRNVKRLLTMAIMVSMMVLGTASMALACIPYPGSTIAIVKGVVYYATGVRT